MRWHFACNADVNGHLPTFKRINIGNDLFLRVLLFSLQTLLAKRFRQMSCANPCLCSRYIVNERSTTLPVALS